jgi:hypothetical protein
VHYSKELRTLLTMARRATAQTEEEQKALSCQAIRDLAYSESIAVIWNVEDVHTQAGEGALTDEQAVNVLWAALDNHDANDGINWQTIQNEIDTELQQ